MKRKEDGKFGVIYVMRIGENYKIGKSSLTFTRLGEYTKLPEIPEYICVGIILNALCFEDEMHELFKEKRIRGEWFKLNKQDLELLCSHIDVRCIFRLDSKGVKEFNIRNQNRLDWAMECMKIRAHAAYFDSKKFSYNEKYVENIIRQRSMLIEKFKKYDDM